MRMGGDETMYARVIRFVLGPDTEWEVKRMADIAYLRAKTAQGFKGGACLHAYDTGEYEWISYWDTMETLEKSLQELYPLFKETVGDRFQWEPSVQIFTCYVPQVEGQ